MPNTAQSTQQNELSLVMKIARRFGDSGWALAEQGTQSATNFLTVAMIGLLGGFSELAVYQMGRFLILLLAGIQNSLISFPYTITFRRLENENADGGAGLAGSQLLLSLGFNLGLIGVIAIGVFASGDQSIVSMLLALLIAAPSYLLREFFRRHDFAHLRTQTTFLFSVLASALQVLGLLLLWQLERVTAANTFLVIAASCGVTVLVWWLIRKRDFKFSIERVWPRLRENWLIGKWIFTTQTLSDSLLTVVQWILILFAGKTAGGVFAACFQVVSLCNPVVMGLANLLPPKFAKSISELKQEDLLRSIRNFNQTFILILGVLMIGIVVFCNELLGLVSKQPVEHAHHLMIVLSAMMLVQAIGLPSFHGLNAIEKPEKALWPRVIGIGFGIIFLGLIGVWWGALGAAYTLLIANGVISVLTYFQLKQELRPDNQIFGK